MRIRLRVIQAKTYRPKTTNMAGWLEFILTYLQGRRREEKGEKRESSDIKGKCEVE
jgi:hypothetical protein